MSARKGCPERAKKPERSRKEPGVIKRAMSKRKMGTRKWMMFLFRQN